ncbi:MAG: ABC transporter substrate-binding protein [Anaerolineae bacterium]|nr:ABC transporter substrate-binding protein [Anaerolineae bacterium]
MADHRCVQNQPRQGWAIVAAMVVFSLLLTGCGGAAQPKTYTIGVINLAPTLEETLAGFKQGMADLGYIEGENVSYIYTGPAGSIDELDDIAQDLVRANVDLIFSISTPATQAAQKATAGNEIPVVFGILTDPVGAGVVASLAQPGGNITGVTFGPQEARRLEWLTRIVPAVKRVYIIYHPEDTSANLAMKTVTATAATLGLEIVSREARNADEVAAALADFPENVDALYMLPDSQTEASLAEILAAANARQLPTSVANVERVEDGVLYSYAMKQVPTGQQAARIADQILEGIKPADLPVETTEFFLAINLKTAQAIGLTLPDDILSQADTIYR